MRGEVKTKAQALVSSLYELQGSRVAIAERVKDLLTKKKYTFKVPDTVCYLPACHESVTDSTFSVGVCTATLFLKISSPNNGSHMPAVKAAEDTVDSSIQCLSQSLHWLLPP